MPINVRIGEHYPLVLMCPPLSRAEHEPDEEPSPERRQHQGSQDPHLPTHEDSSGSGRFHNHAARQISRLLTVGSTSVEHSVLIVS